MKKNMAYNELIRTVHDKVPSYISFLLMLKLDFTDNIFFYMASFFLRFIGILILCGNFQLSQREINETEELSKYLRYFTCYFLLSSTKITNLIYIVISLIILVLFCIRMILYFYVIKKLNSKESLLKLKLTKYQIFMDHFVFLFYPFIIEFLSQIYFSYIFPDNYIFKRDLSEILNIIIVIINTFLLIAYNINNYYYFHLINRPLSDINVPVKYRYSRGKFWAIFLLQNVIIIDCLDFYLIVDKQLEIYRCCYFCFFGIIFIIFFWTSLDKFNYDTLTNRFVSVVSCFCFFSILSEAVVRILKYETKNMYTLIIFNLLKIIISIYFEYLNIKMSNKKLYEKTKIELFKINKGIISDELIYDVFLYIFDVLKKIKKLKKDVSSSDLLNIIYEHLNKCNTNNCKCKLIQILPSGEQYKNNFTNNLIKRIGFLIESTFVQNDFSNDYELTLILSEYFCLFKDNPIMAYSLLQTLLYFNLNVLSMEQLLNLYETCQKYVENSLSLNWHKTFINIYGKKNRLNFQEKEDIVSINLLKEKKFRETFLIYSKIKNIQLMMTDYCTMATDIMKQKTLLEETVKIVKSEEGTEINKIEFQYLSSQNIENLLKILKKETEIHHQLLEQIANLKTSKLPFEFYYKIFSFFEVFYEGKIDETLLPIFYSFTNDHNLYSTQINPNIYILLRQRFIDLNKQGFSSHYCIFKYCQGMTICFFSEPLSQELGYYKEDLIDSNIDILLPVDIVKPHYNMMLHYLITEQNRIFQTINNRMFNKKGMSINSILTGASLPGMGKYLLIITKIDLNEKINDLYFYYNSNLELISISNNNYTLMNLDLNLVSLCKLDLLSIYNIDENKIKQKLNHSKCLLDEFKYNLDITSEEFFTKKLFKQSFKNKIGKFKLLEEIENHQSDEEKSITNINQKTIKLKKILEAIYNNEYKKKVKLPELKFRTIKRNVIENMNKYLSENDNIDYNDESYNKLSECINLFKNSNSKILDKNLNYHSMDNILDIIIKFEVLYDTPFISVKIQEQINYEKLQNNDFLSFKKTKSNSKPPTYNRSIEAGQKSITIKSQTSTIANNKMINIQNKFKENKIKCEKYISQIIIFLLCCILIIYIIILIYQLKVIHNLKTIFMAFYYNYIQRDKLVNLYSFLISGYFRYVNIVNYNEIISMDDFRINIQAVAKSYSSSFHTFYQNYVNYRFVLGKDLSPLYETFNITRIAVSWSEYTISTNYMKEAENMVYVSILSTNKDSDEDIKNDEEIFFNSSYIYENFSSLGQRIKSNYIRVLFYLCRNYQGPYSAFFKKLQNEIRNNFNSYSNKTRAIYISIETLGLVMNAIITIIVVYFLIQTNKVVFRNLVNLFIDFTQDGEYNFKNNHDNYIVMEKLKQLQFMFNNFSLKSIDKYNKKLNYNTIDLFQDLSQDISLESIISSGNKNTKNAKQETKSKIKTKSNEKTLNNTNNKSTTLLNSKTNNEFLNDKDVNLISKLNQRMKKIKDVTNMSSGQSLLNNLNISVQIANNNNKKEEDNKLLTIETIMDKVQINNVKKIKINFWIFLGIIFCVIIYFLLKIIITIKYLNNYSRLFEVYSIITFGYSKAINYLSNLQLLLINQRLGREYILDVMVEEVEEQNLNENKVKAESLIHYKKVYDIFQILNSKQNGTIDSNFENVLCEESKYCRRVLNSKYNIVNNGIDIALKAMIVVINNYYNDFKKLRNEINSFDKIIQYFTGFKYSQVDLCLNYLLSNIEERVANIFLIEIDELVDDFDSTIISLDVVIIVFIFISSLILVFVIIQSLLDLVDLVQSSTTRLNRAISYIKIQNLSS